MMPDPAGWIDPGGPDPWPDPLWWPEASELED